jgi:hypothetical protein
MKDNKHTDRHLQSTGIAHWARPDALKVGHSQFWDAQDAIAIPNCCFERVRDEIKHSYDFKLSLLGNSYSK